MTNLDTHLVCPPTSDCCRKTMTTRQ
jgi:hypothetical protein